MPLFLVTWHHEWSEHAVHGVALVRAAHRPAAEQALRADAGEAGEVAIDDVRQVEDSGRTGVLGYAAQAPAPLRADRGEPALAEAAMRDACRAAGAGDEMVEDPLTTLAIETALARAARAERALAWFTERRPESLGGLTPAEAVARGNALGVLECVVRYPVD